MKVEIRQKFLAKLKLLVEHIEKKQKEEFHNVEKTLHMHLSDDKIRFAIIRDIKRGLRTRDSKLFDMKKEQYISDLAVMSPEFFQLMKRFEYSLFDQERLKYVRKDEIMIASDWRLLYNFMKAVI